MSELSSHGYVIHRRPYRESSYIVELLTRDYGRIGLVARKSRGRAATNQAAMESFNRVRVKWRGRGELKTLTGVEEAGRFRLERDRLIYGLYLNELILRSFARFQESQELFELYELSLGGLVSDPDPWAPLLRFELGLLGVLGYALNLETECRSGEPLVADRRYMYKLDEGAIASVCATAKGSVSGGTLLAMGAGDFTNRQVRREARGLLEQALLSLLSGRELKSKKMLDRLFDD